MDISWNIVLDKMKIYQAESLLPEGENPFLCSVALYSRNSVRFSKKILYVCLAKDLKTMSDKVRKDIKLVCLGNKACVEKFLKRHPGNIMLIPADSPLIDVINFLLKLFSTLAVWDRELKLAVAQHQSLQYILDMSQGMFGDNPIVMIGPSYNILAATKVSKLEHPGVSRLLRLGYFTKEDADNLYHFDYMKKNTVFTTPTIKYPPNLMNCPFLIKTFLCHHSIRNFLVVYYINSMPEESDPELFDLLAMRLEECLKDTMHDLAHRHSLLEMFLEDLISQTYENEEYLRDRAHFLNLHLESTYRLGIIKLKDYTQELAEYLLMRIRTGVSSNRYRIMIFRQSILILILKDKETPETKADSNEKLRELSSLLASYQSAVGLSNRFEGLVKINLAYAQCCSAVKYGWMLSPSQTIFNYSQYYIYEMLDKYKESFPLETLYVQKLKLLEKNGDYRHSNLFLLKIFLMAERNISTTAKAMFMHRNSVIYRVAKIQEVLELNLDDPDVRLRLMMSFKILDMIHGELDQDAIETLGLAVNMYEQE